MDEIDNELKIPQVKYIDVDKLNQEHLTPNIINDKNTFKCDIEEFENKLNNNDIATDFMFFDFSEIKEMQKDFFNLLEYVKADLDGNWENVEPKVYKRLLKRWIKNM
jgi:spore coat polysaccharide biosynthesis protein SpsF (cytidylyltransferase family)